MSKRNQQNKYRRVGKRGEQGAKILLETYGWYIADNQIQGLAGDDIFARDPDGKWWSVEVKNTKVFEDCYVHQAKQQAVERKTKINRHAAKSQLNKEVMEFLGMTDFSVKNWLVLWHPRNVRTRSRMWVGAARDRDGYTHYMAPFEGIVDVTYKEEDVYANPSSTEGALSQDIGEYGNCGGAADGGGCEPGCSCTPETRLDGEAD